MGGEASHRYEKDYSLRKWKEAMLTVSDRLHVIKSKLRILAQQDTRRQIFGAREHTYQLHPVITVAELSAFERQHAIVLPAGYRDFLLSVGNGGAGPYYGLFSLQQYKGGREAIKDDFLSLAFPLCEAWNAVEESVDKYVLDEYFSYFGNYWTQGAMVICHFGCGAYFLLVVSGPERGQIWFDDRASDCGLSPWGCDFLTWYESWLDGSLRCLQELVQSNH